MTTGEIQAGERTQRINAEVQRRLGRSYSWAEELYFLGDPCVARITDYEQNILDEIIRQADVILRQTQHTPGPWRLNDNGWHITANPVDDPANEGSKRRALVATVDGGEYLLPFPARRANARLIAAAPELLEALKRIMEYAHLGASVCDVDVNEQPQFIKAREAISKAEGK